MEYPAYFTNKFFNKDPILFEYDKGIVQVEGNHLNESYVPLTFTIENDITYEQAFQMGEILKHVVTKVWNTKVTQMEITERENYFVFNPITEFGISVFVKDEQTHFQEINLKEIVGYSLLSDSLLARYALNKELSEISLEELGVKYFHGFAVIPTVIRTVIPTEKIIDIESYIRKLESEGYFAYSFGVFDLEDQEIIRELCMLFDIKIIDDRDKTRYILQTDVDFHVSPEIWLRNALPIIRSGNYPSFTLQFFEYDNDYERKHGNVFKDVILEYIAFMAYAQLSDIYPIIQSFSFFTRVNIDYSITVSLPSYKLVQEYREIVKRLMENKYVVEPCKSLMEGVIKRWIVQSVDNDSYPMLLKDNMLVHRSPFISYSFESFESFESFNIEKGKTELLSKLREYYSKTKVCHDDLEPVEMEKISQMNLEELLNLIPITENGITYCFSKNTITNVDTNPLTRKPLTDKTLLRLKYMEYGLRGLFDIGPLYGLYPDVPVKIDVKINKGIPKYTRIRVDEKQRELVGNLFLVEIVFEDGTTTPLFEISLPTVNLEKIDEMKNSVDKLWPRGFFLNYWFTVVNTFLDLKSFPVLTTNPMLLRAKDSTVDGDRALEYLLSSI